MCYIYREGSGKFSPGTFSDFHISAVASQSAVDLSNQLHVVEQRVEAVEVGEADLMRRATPCNLGKKEEGYFNKQPNKKNKLQHSRASGCYCYENTHSVKHGG